MNEQKPVDLKALLNKIHEVRAESPELASQMMDEFSKQADHVREMNRKGLEAENRSMLIGHVFGLIIGLTAIVSGAVVAVQSSQWASQLAGGFIGGGGVISLVSVFVLGKRKP